jgi:hypothetical protein
MCYWRRTWTFSACDSQSENDFLKMKQMRLDHELAVRTENADDHEADRTL